ncbi:hypothetical protein [Laceyella tengchongensis]|jgi:hypothetical protein|uniref:hypothetical protein n=1 Tax=Laceyella tengchongensis TaxID=574699 RepID=UPI0012B9F7E0|nr:hypothetical protein [Laceyella tengchongensis]
MNSILPKLRDPKVWGLMFAFVKVFLGALHVNIAPEEWQLWENAFNAACGVTVALGIFAYNPNQKEEK